MRNVSLAVVATACLMVVEVSHAGEESYAAEVTASRLHLRAGPGASYQSVVFAEAGDRVVVREAIEGGWAIVEVPGGYRAWVSGRFLDRAGGKGTVTVDNLLVRPRPTTRYHQLAGKLKKGEALEVLGEKTVDDETWIAVRVPQRVPLYCSASYLKKIGPPSMATPKVEKEEEAAPAPGKEPDPAAGSQDAKFVVVEKRALEALRGARSLDDLKPIHRTVASVDEGRLSLENRKRRVALERKLLERERELIVASVHEHEKELLARLEKQIKAIEAKYQARLKELEEERAKKKQGANRYNAVGIVEYKPHIFGSTPAFRITHAGKLRYYLIAPAFNLHKFAGKRVGVIGLMDRESGTGYFTIIAKRIEIIADE